jgi:arabinofuranosyltransferase
MTSPSWPRYAGPPTGMLVLETCGLLGAGGIDWGPKYYMLDECALADPLLARLPAVFNPGWRIGHFRRLVPEGYHNSQGALNNQLTDPGLCALFDDIRTVTQSRVLLSTRRLAAIWRLNTGASAANVDRRFYRHAGSVAPLDRLATVIADGTPVDAPGVRVVELPLAVFVDDQPGRRFLDLSLDSNDRYQLIFLKRGQDVGQIDLGPVPPHRRQPGLATYAPELPPDATRLGFDTIVITPTAGDDPKGIGHLLLDGYPPTDAELKRRAAVRDAMPR